MKRLLAVICVLCVVSLGQAYAQTKTYNFNRQLPAAEPSPGAVKLQERHAVREKPLDPGARVVSGMPWLQDTTLDEGEDETPENLVKRIAFQKGMVEISDATYRELDKVAADLQKDQAVRLGLNCFAEAEREDGSDSRRVSMQRALAIREYLIGKGIDSTRINVRVLGDTASVEPKDRVDIIVN